MGIIDELSNIATIEQFYESLEKKKEYHLELFTREVFLYRLKCEQGLEFPYNSREQIRLNLFEHPTKSILDIQSSSHNMLWYYLQLGLGVANMMMLTFNVSKHELEKLKSFQVTILYTLFLFFQLVVMTANTVNMNRR